jgi:aryl-alcohol dehydrogenase-like predicted oxidoreductase
MKGTDNVALPMRPLGRSGRETSVIGFGTWPIGGARYGSSDDAEALKALATALDLGVTLFDTAPSYGNGHAEELLGQALTGRRDDVLVVTKGGLVWDDASNVLGRDSSRARLEQGLDESLRRLGTDYLDVFMIHWPDAETPFEQVAEALLAIKASGKARAIGVSNFTGPQMREMARLVDPEPLVVNQFSFNLFDTRWAERCFDDCRDLGISVMPYGALAHGLLAGSITRETVFDERDWRRSGMIFGQALLTPENRETNHQVVDELAAFARELGATLPQLALAWTLHHDVVAVSLVGARTANEIEEAAGAATLRLDDAAMLRISQIMEKAAGRSQEVLA